MGVDGQLALTRYRVTVEALEPLALPTYLGSTLRGAFGHAFRALCYPARPGEPCPLPESCPYHLVFAIWVFGQWVHVGKGATFGLGGYRLEPIAAREGSWG